MVLPDKTTESLLRVLFFKTFFVVVVFVIIYISRVVEFHVISIFSYKLVLQKCIGIIIIITIIII